MESEPDTLDTPVIPEPQPLRRLSGLARFLWPGLLLVYLILFTSTGYLAFLEPDKNPGFDNRAAILQIEDETTKNFVIESLRQEDLEHKKKRELANQSFNIVLGALLGFLSASAASMLGGREDE